jgi:ribosomal protein L30/L7E
MHQVVEQADSPVTRGMVQKVAHLVRIVEDN